MEEYATLPAELTLREVRIRVVQKGLRTRSLVVATTPMCYASGLALAAWRVLAISSLMARR